MDLEPKYIEEVRRDINPIPLIELDRQHVPSRPSTFGVFVPNSADPKHGEGHFTAVIFHPGGYLEYYDPLGRNSGLTAVLQMAKNRGWPREYLTRTNIKTNRGDPTQNAKSHTCADHICERLSYKDADYKMFKQLLIATASKELLNKDVFFE